MRIAENLGITLNEALDLPSWEFVSWAEKWSKEPPPLERVEIAIAYLCTLFYNSKKGKSKPAKKISDFMVFRDAWKVAKQQYVSDEDVNDDLNTLIDAFGRDKLVVDWSNKNGGNRQG